MFVLPIITSVSSGNYDKKDCYFNKLMFVVQNLNIGLSTYVLWHV